MEAQVTAEWCRGKHILDAGCGNGELTPTRALAGLGATVLGIDYSSSVQRATGAPNVTFIQADLQHPPVPPASFDLVISNGVLHHTPNTQRTFAAVAALVKAGGRFYVWLYHRRWAMTLTDWPRVVVTRLPQTPQAIAVRTYAKALMVAHRLLRRRSSRSWPERVVDAYDSITPRYRHYHTPVELARWFHRAGFGPATLAHWDNAYGFGMVAVKVAQDQTPGIQFGQSAATLRGR